MIVFFSRIQSFLLYLLNFENNSGCNKWFYNNPYYIYIFFYYLTIWNLYSILNTTNKKELRWSIIKFKNSKIRIKKQQNLYIILLY